MTIEQFCDDLETIKDEVVWEFISKGKIRCRVKKDKGYCCPITALCSLKHNRVFFVDEPRGAGKLLGLEDTDIDMIMASADFFCSWDSAYSADTRVRLFIATGLTGQW